MLGAYVHRPTAIAHSSNTTVTASPTAIHTAVGASTRGANGQEARRNASAGTTYAAEAITTVAQRRNGGRRRQVIRRLQRAKG